MGTLRWTELRSTGGFIGLALGLALFAPHRLRIGTRRELGWLAFYGIVGFAVVQWLYFVAIERLPIGIGLLFEFSAPRADRALGPVRLARAGAAARVAGARSRDRRPHPRGAGLARHVARRPRRRRRAPRRGRALRLLPDGRAPGRAPRPALGRLLRARLRLARLGDPAALVELPDRRRSGSASSCRTASSRCRSARSRCGGSCSARSCPSRSRSRRSSTCPRRRSGSWRRSSRSPRR